ncbi:MAG: hypothetical protein CMI13_10640 [Oleibacter sp.]|nr:hypothetical protein [Thalassolituus sp.]|tara:strand:- start:39 stop:515 length:477 start_codon:yes stop_codon:yes gene_type:complete
MDYPTNDASARLGTDGKFTDGDALQGIPPSRDGADFMNAVYDEIIAMIVAGAGTPNTTNRTQLRDAILQRINSAMVTRAPTNHTHAASESKVITGIALVASNSIDVVSFSSNILGAVVCFNSTDNLETACGCTWSGNTLSLRNSSGSATNLTYIVVLS